MLKVPAVSIDQPVKVAYPSCGKLDIMYCSGRSLSEVKYTDRTKTVDSCVVLGVSSREQ